MVVIFMLTETEYFFVLVKIANIFLNFNFILQNILQNELSLLNIYLKKKEQPCTTS